MHVLRGAVHVLRVDFSSLQAMKEKYEPQSFCVDLNDALVFARESKTGAQLWRGAYSHCSRKFLDIEGVG